TARIAADVPRCMRIQRLRVPLGSTTSSSEMGGHASRIRFVVTTCGSEAVQSPVEAGLGDPTTYGRRRRPNCKERPTEHNSYYERPRYARDARQVLAEGEAREGERREDRREKREGRKESDARRA